MTGALVLVAGYLLGGVPTADWLAHRRGIDLRGRGSGNPGANNALRLGGRRLAATVLTVEIVKGIVCVGVGAFFQGDSGMALAGLGAAAGNVLNPYRSFRGGQGLGIAAGVLLAAFPVGAAMGIMAIAVAVRIVRWAAPATLIALVIVVLAARWMPPSPWGIEHEGWATFLATGLAATVAPKQLRRLTRSARPPRPRPA